MKFTAFNELLLSSNVNESTRFWRNGCQFLIARFSQCAIVASSSVALNTRMSSMYPTYGESVGLAAVPPNASPILPPPEQHPGLNAPMFVTTFESVPLNKKRTLCAVKSTTTAMCCHSSCCTICVLNAELEQFLT